MLKKLVQRGIIMKHMPEEVWEETLYLYPKKYSIIEYDACPYYIDYGDGKPLREFYNYETHPTMDVYSVYPCKEDTPKVESKANKFKDRLKNALKK